MDDWLTWAFWTETIRGSAHFACALIAIGLGPIIFFRRKGDVSHRWLGRLWALCMLIITGSALIMYDMHGRPNLFHFFAVVSLATITPGVLAIRKYKRTKERKYLIAHQHCMAWAYFGLAAAGVWQIAFTIVRLGHLKISIAWLYNGLGFITALISIGLFFFLARKYPDQNTAK